MANKIRYNYDLLKTIIEENKIELLEDYSKFTIINRETIIKGICSNYNCKNEYKKNFRSFHNTKSLCNDCVKKVSSENTRKTMIEICKNKVVANQNITYKYNLESLVNFTKENNIKLLVDYSTLDTIRKDTKIKGNCKGDNCKNIFEKGFRELRTKGGPYCRDCTNKNKYKNVEKKAVSNKKNKQEKNNDIVIKTHYNFKSDEEKQKIKDKISNSYHQKSEEEKELILQKRIDTNNKIFNHDYPLQNPDILQNRKDILKNKTVEQKNMSINKRKETNLNKYGSEVPTQNKNILQKISNTNLIKYGFECVLQNEEIKDKIKKTNIKKYGVEHVSKCPEIMDKISKKCYSKKNYISSSGKEYQCQGYEPQALKILIEEMRIQEENIITGTINVPKINYIGADKKEHVHYPDIYLNHQKKIIEVKSTWTIKKKKDNVFVKQAAAKEQGYLYEIWVLNKKGDILEKFI